MTDLDELAHIVELISKDFENTLTTSNKPQIGTQTVYQSISEKALDQTPVSLNEEQKQRIYNEFYSAGPLEPWITNTDVTEIMITSPRDIWIECGGKFHKIDDCFLTQLTFNNFIHRVCEESQCFTNYNTPFANGIWRNFRVHLASPPVVTQHTLTLRRVRPISLSLTEMQHTDWCSPTQLEVLRKIVRTQKNCLIVGNTGSGKTTLINALVREAPEERCIFIEDTSELICANSASLKLLTRFDSQGSLPEITQGDLVQQSLRMRPDRLILGEIRGSEAKDFLMALSTGHKGSMASLHASSASEAFLRLEMLIQMGAPQWSLEAIRRLIQLTIDCVIVTRKESKKWYMEGIYKISSQEKFGFIFETYD